MSYLPPSDRSVLAPLAALVFAIPVIGWALHCILVDERIEAKLTGVGILLLVWVLSFTIFGFAAFIFPLLAFVPLMFAWLLALTWG